jgi:4-hydroxy-4-methyl-2-oxoglutarate aldolase
MTIAIALIEQLSEFETALVAEATGAMGGREPEKYYTGNDVRLLTDISEPMVGVALTFTGDTSTPANTADVEDLYKGYELIRQSSLPTVVVMKAVGSRPNHECMLGDGMAKTLKSYGSCGFISDGGARDINGINKVGYPVFGSGTVSNHVKMIYKLSQEPVCISDVTFANGDLIHADRDGILLIPSEFHAGIVEACVLTRDFETRVHVFWRRSDKTAYEKRDYVMQMAKEHHDKCKSLLH